MIRCAPVTVLVAASTLTWLGVAQAQTPPPAPSPPAASPPAEVVPISPVSPGVAPPAPLPSASPTSDVGLPAAVVHDQLDEPTRSFKVGVGTRGRMVSVPGWLLDTFTKKNVPLTSWGFGLEGFLRRGNLDFVMALGVQQMSPDDGNWLGKGKGAMIDTDFVQFRDLRFYSLDLSLIWHHSFNDWFGIHYGAGLGVGIVTGQILRTSNANCTEENAGDLSRCHPLNVNCTAGGCNEAQLKASEGGGVDDVATPHRFSESAIPGAIPIINVVLGLNFKLGAGLEARVEGGFYDAFFLGSALAYTF